MYVDEGRKTVKGADGMDMFLHIGGDRIIQTKSIIGIFDMDNTTVSKHTRNFLRGAETKQQVENIADDIPRTFVVTSDNMVYMTNISSATLLQRAATSNL